jgi:hypothetical protein
VRDCVVPGESSVSMWVGDYSQPLEDRGRWLIRGSSDIQSRRHRGATAAASSPMAEFDPFGPSNIHCQRVMSGGKGSNRQGHSRDYLTFEPFCRRPQTQTWMGPPGSMTRHSHSPSCGRRAFRSSCRFLGAKYTPSNLERISTPAIRVIPRIESFTLTSADDQILVRPTKCAPDDKLPLFVPDKFSYNVRRFNVDQMHFVCGRVD